MRLRIHPRPWPYYPLRRPRPSSQARRPERRTDGYPKISNYSVVSIPCDLTLCRPEEALTFDFGGNHARLSEHPLGSESHNALRARAPIRSNPLIFLRCANSESVLLRPYFSDHQYPYSTGGTASQISVLVLHPTRVNVRPGRASLPFHVSVIRLHRALVAGLSMVLRSHT
jgi:hypothetical protein